MITYQVVAFLASMVIFWRCESILNLMGRECRFLVRVACWFLTVGSAGIILTITQGYEPNFPISMALCGMALYMTSERRVRGLLRINLPVDIEKRVI